VKQEADLSEAETHRIISDIVRTYGPYLRKFLMRRGIPARDVDDELQQVWETVRKNVRRLRGKLQTWLLRVAINRAGNYYQKRRKHRRLVLGLEQNICDQNPDAEEAFIGAGFRDQNPNSEELLIGAELARLVDGLDPELRLTMRAFMSGETVEEMSERLQLPIGTCNSRLRRARARIKAALAHSEIVLPALGTRSDTPRRTGTIELSSARG
jgi:RNA polymerase sigma factor (sigma-70 family)